MTPKPSERVARGSMGRWILSLGAGHVSCKSVSMILPPATEVPDAALRTIAERLGLRGTSWSAFASVGLSSSIYTLGDAFVLKVPRQHPQTITAARAETIAAAAAHAAGVHTPAVVLFDDTCALLPVPFTVYERVPGVPLASVASDTATTAAVWRALGRDLAVLHTRVARTVPTSGVLADAAYDDPRPWLDDLVTCGVVVPGEAGWLRAWLERLEAVRHTYDTTWFIHGDVNAGNVIVSP